MHAARILVAALALLAWSAALSAQAPASADALEQRATEFFTAGKTTDAIAALEQVRGMRRASGERALEARALWRLAIGYRGAGRNDDAARAARAAYGLATAASDDAIAADALGQLFQINSYTPDFPDADRILDEALRLARHANQPRTLARILDSRARRFGDTGRLDDAIRSATEGLEHAQSAGDQALVTGLYAIRATFVSRSGLLADALGDALRARNAAAKVGPRAEVTALFALAQSHSNLSNAQEAVRLWTDVIDRYRALGPPVGVPIALDARSHIQYEAANFEASLADARDSISGYTALKMRPVAPSFSRAGMANIRLGRDTEGRRWLAEAETRLQNAPDYEQVQTWTQLGISYNLLGDAANARRAFDQVVAYAHRRGSLEDEQRAQIGLGRAALVAHDPATAITHLEQAAAIIEKLRATVPAQELRAAYLSRRVEAHEWLVAALMMQSATPADRYVEQAFDTAERARVRALADLLAEGRAKRRATGTVEPPRARTRTEIAANLAPGEVLLEYLVGEEHAYGWALSRDGLIGFKLPSPPELDATVRRTLDYISNDDREGLQRLAEELTPALLGPVLAQLPRLQRIIFVPDGPLQRLPFAALPLPDTPAYLVQRVAISTVGSGSLLELLKRDTPSHGVLALAAANDSARPSASSRSTGAPLREVRGEVHDAIRLLAPADGGRSMANATELAVKTGGLADYRVIHVAAHSLIDEAFPRNSAILLGAEGGEDGALRAAEISQIPVGADLVVLAACRTQFGRIMRGEGFLSLARSFMEAGARSVVASLWDVGDRDTRVLMRGLYAGIAAGLAPDQALRIAQLQMLRTGGHLAAPRAWAGFQVAGEARLPVWSPRAPSVTAISVALLAIAAAVIAVRR